MYISAYPNTMQYIKVEQRSPDLRKGMITLETNSVHYTTVDTVLIYILLYRPIPTKSEKNKHETY